MGDQLLRVENNRTAWTSAYDADQEVTIALKNGEGNFVADPATIEMLEGEGRVLPDGMERGEEDAELQGPVHGRRA